MVPVMSEKISWVFVEYSSLFFLLSCILDINAHMYLPEIVNYGMSKLSIPPLN